MQQVVASQPDILEVADLVAIVVAPSTVVVDGEVVLHDTLVVPEVEAVLASAEKALKSAFVEVRYVYLTPVAERRGEVRPRRSE
jgi:hypothetical protein